MKYFYWLLHKLMLPSFYREYRRYQKALQEVGRVQSRLLLSLLSANSRSSYGQKYGFADITCVREFQEKVPLTSYTDYLPFIEQISSGVQGILTSERVLLLEPSGGSTAPSKYIPYTNTLKKQFQYGVYPWLYDLYTRVPGLLRGKAYWSITPARVEKEYTPGGIPIGFEEDGQYLGGLHQLLMDYIFAVPKEVKDIPDISTFRYVTLLFLLKEKHLTLISVWNPSFLLLLLKPLELWIDGLIRDLAVGTINPPGDLLPELKLKLEKKLGSNVRRAGEIRKCLDNPEATVCQAIWPNLKLISCWTDANAAAAARDLQACFPGVQIQGKGLLATEGFVSFPQVGEEGALLSVNSHFYEFIEYRPHSESPDSIRLASELKEGKTYSVVITTGGGLYRYRLQDLVRVAGFTRGCPRLVFMGKEERVSDYCGEKLNELHVRVLIDELLQKHGITAGFYMLAPEMAGQAIYFYVLYLEIRDRQWAAAKLSSSSRHDGRSSLANLLSDLEKGLQENFHYKYCRRLGQLEEPKLFLIDGKEGLTGTEVYDRVCRSAGQKAGDIKPAALHHRTGWAAKFPGKFL